MDNAEKRWWIEEIESNIVRRRGVETQLAWGVLATVGILFYSRNSPQPCLDPPQIRMARRPKTDEAGNCIRENTALRTKFRGGV